MSEGRLMHVKTTAKQSKTMEVGGSSSSRGSRTTTRNFKDGGFVSLVEKKLFTLDEDLFMQVRGLTSDGFPLGDYNDELWNSYDTEEMYKSCMGGPYYYVEGDSTKVGSFSVENRLIHYVIAYILVQRSTNHAH
ncbi:hypothetical protein Lal_00039319 [Lupinus albus]|nr:hypothetical protein Lal_00039319 [Lupinus albus]